MKLKMKAVSNVIILFIICSCVLSFVSFLKFNTWNAYSAISGVYQIRHTDTDVVMLKGSSQVALAKPGIQIEDYMASQGLELEEQLGALQVYTNGDMQEYVMVSTNKYYSKWTWR